MATRRDRSLLLLLLLLGTIIDLVALDRSSFSNVNARLHALAQNNQQRLISSTQNASSLSSAFTSMLDQVSNYTSALEQATMLAQQNRTQHANQYATNLNAASSIPTSATTAAHQAAGQKTAWSGNEANGYANDWTTNRRELRCAEPGCEATALQEIPRKVRRAEEEWTLGSGHVVEALMHYNALRRRPRRPRRSSRSPRRRSSSRMRWTTRRRAGAACRGSRSTASPCASLSAGALPRSAAHPRVALPSASAGPVG